MKEITLFVLRLPGERRFLRSREILKDAASLHTGLSREEFETENLPGGKPRFVKHPEIEFSLSHTAGVWACAFSRDLPAGLPVGLDVQAYASPRSMERLITRYFHPSEREYVHAASDPAGAFSRIWCRKEAAVKLSGRGIDGRFSEFSTVLPGEDPDEAHPSPPLFLESSPDGPFRLSELVLPLFCPEPGEADEPGEARKASPPVYAALAHPVPFSVKFFAMPSTMTDQGAPHAVQFD